MKTVALHNLGCKVNGYEMDVMQQKLQENGYIIVPFDEAADIYIINTCTISYSIIFSLISKVINIYTRQAKKVISLIIYIIKS